MIRPQNKHSGVVWGKESDLMQCFKAEATSRVIHKHILLGNLLWFFFSHLHVSSSYNPFHVLISSHLSTLSATHFAHKQLQTCACNMRQQVLLWRRGFTVMQKERGAQRLKISGSNISLSVVIVCYFPLHEALKHTIQQTIHFHRLEFKVLFWITIKTPRRENAVTKYPERHFPPQLGKEALRWGGETRILIVLLEKLGKVIKRNGKHMGKN